MSYIAHSLGQNEIFLYRARFPWFRSASAWGLVVVFTAMGILAAAYGYGWLTALLMLAGVALLLWIMVPLWTTEIGVTNQRFIYKRGFLWRTTHDLQLRAVEEVNLDQGLLGRIFDFGRLELRGTGMDHIRLPALADPVGLRKALQDGMAGAQPITVVDPGPAPRSGGISQSAA